jgi:hypothetical protein
MKKLLILLWFIPALAFNQTFDLNKTGLSQDTSFLNDLTLDSSVDKGVTLENDSLKYAVISNINEQRMTHITADTIRDISADDQDTVLTIKLTIDVADDDSIAVFPSAKTIDMKVFIFGDDEWALVSVQTDGTVTIPVDIGNVVNTNTDGNLVIWNYSGTSISIVNRLGASKKIRVIYSHLE